MIRHMVEYTMVRAIIGCPYSLRRLLCRSAADIYLSLDRKRHNVILENLHRVFPDLPEDAIARIVSASYRHLAQLCAEYPEIRRFSMSTVDKYVDWGNDAEIIENLLAKGRGILFISGHVGNWEVCAAALATKGFLTGGVVRTLDNQLLDNLIRSFREHTGAGAWDKTGAVPKMYAALRDGKGVGMLIDQDAGRNGVFIPFFGTPASTYPTHVDLAQRAGAPLVTMAMYRTGPLRYRFTIGDITFPLDRSHAISGRMKQLEAVNRSLERLILREPTQYLWQHRRWKTRPQAGASIKDSQQKLQPARAYAVEATPVLVGADAMPSGVRS